MTRVVVHTRFSSNVLSAASIDNQGRLRAARNEGDAGVLLFAAGEGVGVAATKKCVAATRVEVQIG